MTKELSTPVTWQKIMLLIALAILVGVSGFKLSSDSGLGNGLKDKTTMEELAQDAGN